LTSDSCERLAAAAAEDPWTPKQPLVGENGYGQACFQGGSSEHLSERLMPPPLNFENSPSPVGEAVTRFDGDYSADSDQVVFS
jgi:hypothetical protein